MSQDLFGICPYVTAQQVLRGKWSIVVLHQLEDGPVRFNELQRRLPDMTHATLAKQLRSLEGYGVVVRTEYPQVPPKVEYALSPLGQEFRPVLAQFEACRKGDFTDQELEASRRAVVSSLTACLDSQGRLEDYWLAQAAAGQAQPPEALARQVEEVTASQVSALAGQMKLDAVYFLKGKEG